MTKSWGGLKDAAQNWVLRTGRSNMEQRSNGKVMEHAPSEKGRATRVADARKIRIAYLSGPCDGPAVYREWRERGQQDYFGTDFMKQFLQLAEDLDAESYIVTSRRGEYSAVRCGRFVFDNHPNPVGLKGAMYHLAFLPWFARIVPKIVRFKPDVLIATENAPYWFLLTPLRWFGIPIIPSFHPVPWPQYAPRKWSSRVLWQLNRFLILRHLKAMVVISNAITRELSSLLGPDMLRIEVLRHLPSYPPSQFESIPLPDIGSQPPFRVFFIGRIETNKGIYDLVEIARRLEEKRRGQFLFDICGAGGELDNLRRRIAELNLQNVVVSHGYCSAQKVEMLLGKSHAVIVPSRSDFDAGFEMVCAEAILSNRPLVASAVCPALEDLREASIEVQPDNVDQYCGAILRLSDEREFYLDKQAACFALHEPFYNPENSWATKIKEALSKHIKILAPSADSQDVHSPGP
jgi:glycosyltransferase involved in cell wall biosynthesis